MGDKSIQLGPGGPVSACHPVESVALTSRRVGWPLAVGCNEGGCGACKVHIASGSYELTGALSRRHLTREEQASGYALACRVKPQSPLVIDEYHRWQRLDSFRTVLRRVRHNGKTWIEEELK